MLFIDNPTVEKVLSMAECVEAQDIAFRGLPSGASVHRPRIDVYVPTERTDAYYRWGTMEGASKDLGVFAIRMKSDILHWPTDEHGNWQEDKYCMEPGLYCGLVFLFSTRNGEPLAMINDGLIQHMRVGGGAGLGVKYLSREDSHTVAMIGSGGMARTYLEAFCAVRDIQKVRVFSPTRANREAYAVEMAEKLGLDIEPVERPEPGRPGRGHRGRVHQRHGSGPQRSLAGSRPARHGRTWRDRRRRLRSRDYHVQARRLPQLAA